MNDLRNKIEKRQAKVALIGLGYVGLPMAVAFAQAGFPVLGIDNDTERVKNLQAGHSYILDVHDESLAAVKSNFKAGSDFAVLHEADVVIICVPTPLRKTKDPDLSYILSATSQVARHLHNGQLIILESTTYPGTTDEIILPELRKTGLRAGVDFYLAFSPERTDPGNTKFNIRNTPKIVGGVSQESGELASQLYSAIVETVVTVSSAKTAEMVKLLENTFRAINIGMVNEMAIMCEKLGIDTWEVINAAATKPFGFMPFYPGPGLGGHCIPVDPHYLSWKLKTLNYAARFIELAGEINSSMPAYVVQKISDALNDDHKSVRGSQIFILGAAYKRDSNDVRESPALDICKLLLAKGAHVSYHDPYVSEVRLDGVPIQRVKLDPAGLKAMDCVVIVTDHSAYDWQLIVDHSRLVMDTRNATAKVKNPACRIVKL
ncbi:MAG TPA: nucleotide sugar dehydrogenase [Acidobacteriota bacterium]|nr:nucleotide sugar dehydrogenase [Acidobacteriota bacterium]